MPALKPKQQIHVMRFTNTQVAIMIAALSDYRNAPGQSIAGNVKNINGLIEKFYKLYGAKEHGQN